MAKAEIGWTRKNEDGIRLDLYARRIGDQWRFFWRERRYESWQALERPPLEDWLTLLDSVERRVARRLARPEDVTRLKKTIREQFPETDLPGGKS
jgi:hypothetical protein